MAAPFTEPWRTTARRTGGIALAIGTCAALLTGRARTLPAVTLVALWFSLGGHLVEVVYLNGLRRHLANGPAMRLLARIAWWLGGGVVLYAGACATQPLFGFVAPPWPWWTGGPALVGIELIAHLVLRLRGLPSFYDGRG